MKNRIKKYLDYTPFLILLIYSIVLIWDISTSIYILSWEHYTGLILLIATGVCFYKRHLYGVLALGILLFLGLIRVVAYTAAIYTSSIWFGSDSSLAIKFQPMFLLLLVLYFVLSGRYFVGILSKKYWDEVKETKR